MKLDNKADYTKGIVLTAILLSSIAAPTVAESEQSSPKAEEPKNVELGLYEGQWVKFKLSEIKIESENDALKLFVKGLLSNVLYQEIEEQDFTLEDIDWIKITIKDVSGTEFVTVKTFGTLDGREIDLAPSTHDLASEEYLFAIPINLKLGEKLSSGLNDTEPLKVKSITKKQISGQDIEAFELVSSNNTVDEESGTASEMNIQAFYDKKTGILLENTLSGSVANILLGTVSFEFGVQAIELEGLEGEKPSTSESPQLAIEEESEQAFISVAMKIKKKSTLLAIKNADDMDIYSVKIKASDGSIRYVKAKGWEREKIDSSTVMIKTLDRPISVGKSLFVILVIDNLGSGIEWTAYDAKTSILSFGASTPKL
jgi:hypothetical protein